ncbi:barstar family protein [Kibdelosporangium lantanae]|uniref:Barstar family protein n=1 Tax=Kibdelosporangium lantanae TaxID=1497396 RepID=A0ABW3MHJ2_9PSEU
MNAVVDGRSIHTKLQMLDALAVALHFPAYFGRNLDALNDLVNDLPPGDHTLTWRHPEPLAKADPDAVNAALAGIAGYFTYSATLPPPKNLETVRAFQRVQGDHALRWLESRLKGTTQ